MTIRLAINSIQHQPKFVKLQNGGQLKIAAGDNIKLLGKAELKTIKNGSDLIIKDASGNKYILKDFYAEASPDKKGQKLSWDDELGERKALLSNGQDSFSQAIVDENFGLFVLGAAGMAGVTAAIAANKKDSHAPFVTNNAIGNVQDVDATVNSIPSQAPNNTPAGITARAVDPDAANTVSYSLVNDAGGRFKIDPDTGVITVADGTALNHAVAQSHTVKVRATSSDGTFSEQDFTINLTANTTPSTNKTPVGVNDTASTNEDIALTLTPAQLLANDSDPDQDSLSIVSVQNAVNGTVALVDGNAVFTPSTNYSGPARFDYTITDSKGGNTTATVNLTVSAQNDAPGTSPVTLTPIAEDSADRVITQAELLANASDIDGPGLSATDLVITSGNGTLVNNQNGSWNYTPALNDASAVSFSYTVTDGSLTAAGSATLDITPVNDAPVAVNDTASTNEDIALTLTPAQLLANDSDPDQDSLSIVSVQNAVNGTVALVDGNAVFTPSTNYSGPARFDYTITDSKGGNASGTDVSIVLQNIAYTSANSDPLFLQNMIANGNLII